MAERKSIVVTGAASGIGCETARLFAQRGWFVGIFDINADGLKALQTELGEENCFFGVMDVTDAESAKDGVSAFAEKTGGKYFRARNTDELKEIYQLLDQLEPVEQDTQSFRPVMALYYWPLAIALILAALITVFRITGISR